MGKPFFEKAGGLRFSCTRCGNCCTRPGPVLFPPDDLKRAAIHLSLAPGQFKKRYKLFREEGIDTLDPGDGQPCTFYDPEAGCTIYEGRPTQCRTWPFWPEVVKRRYSWDRASLECPGMGRGDKHPVEAVRASIDDCAAAGLPEGDPW